MAMAFDKKPFAILALALNRVTKTPEPILCAPLGAC